MQKEKACRTNRQADDVRLLGLLAEHIETEELCLILGICAFKVSVGDLAAFDQLCKADELAKLALEVKAVSLVSYQENVTLTGIDHSKEFLHVYIMELDYVFHLYNLLKVHSC